MHWILGKMDQYSWAAKAQYITPESVGETLPLHDNSGLTITADAIIDNRKELFTMLRVDNELGREMTDNDLFYWLTKSGDQIAPNFCWETLRLHCGMKLGS